MFDHRASRFALEVAILVALAVSVTVAQLNRLVIAGVMLAGWLLVSVVEWASARGEAQFRSGLPQRYSTAQVRLSPARALTHEPVEWHPPVAPVPVVTAVEEPVWVAPPEPVPAFEPEPVIGGWTVAEPEEETLPLEPVAYEIADESGIELLSDPLPAAAADALPATDTPWFVDGLPSDLEADVAPALDASPEPVVEAPAAELEVEQPRVDEPALEYWPEIPASWFTASTEPSVEHDLEPEQIEESRAEEPELGHWFDTQLPGAAAPPDADPALPAWALVDDEPEAEREDELAAEEVLPEELEPLRSAPPAEEAPEFDFDLPVGEPLPDESSAVSPLPEELRVEEQHFAPRTSFEFDDTSLDLDILVERLAGAPLGDDASLVSWFDAELPGAVDITKIEASVDAEFARLTQREEPGVGGWAVDRAEAAWPSSNPSIAGVLDAMPSSELPGAWERPVAEADTGVMDAVSDAPGGTARHSIDPLAGVESVQVPARPVSRLLLPGHAKRDT